MKLPSPRIISGLALCGAALFAFWLWLGPGARGEWSDGQRTVDADRELRIATWGDPVRAWNDLPASADSRVARSSDGRWLVWAAAEASGGHDLFAGELRDGRLVASARIVELATEADECAPAFGGEWLYFSSDRPGGAGGHDLWRAHFADGAAQAPELVPGPANTTGEELDPAPRADGTALVFAADRDGAGMDLYAAPLGDGVATRIDALCSSADEREPAFTQDDRALVFASSRDGGRGGFDLYRSARFGERYVAPEALGILNSAEEERAPLAAADDLALCFLRTEAGANPIFLASPAVELFRAPRRAVDWMEWAALAGLLALALLALLVQRFPELDRIYKCLLASVVLHLLLLWWFHDVWLALGKAEDEPARAPLHIRLEERRPEVPPVPIAPPAPVEVPEPIVRREPEPEPERGVASAAEPTAELALPEAPSEVATSAAPERLELSAERGEPAPPETSVARVAPESTELAAREASEAEPAPAREREIALRDVPSAASAAAPAPRLDLESEALGAPSSTSRAMGMPSRPERQRSRGSPAAGPTSGSVAEAAPERPSLARPSSREGDVELPTRSGAPGALALQDGSEAGAARQAQPAATLDLGRSAAGTVASSRAGRSGAPERASETRNARTAEPARPSSGDSVAESAAEQAPEGVAALPRSTSATGTPSRSQSSNTAALDPSARESVAASAEEAPALGLESLARAPKTSGSAEPAGRGPQRATGRDATPRPAADATQAGESLAARGAAPAVGLPRAQDGVSERAPQGERREVSLADAPDSVARPAEGGGAGTAKDWLPDLGAPPSARSGSGAPVSSGPERASSPESRARAAAPLAENAPSLARAPEPPKEDQPKPAKSDWDSTPYQNRSGAEKARALKLYGGSERTEAAVARGLEYLARIQHANGAWGNVDAQDEKYGRVAVGKTALCTLAFLGAGHTPASATEHSAVVARALDFLLGMQDQDSGHFGDASAYDHGIATYAIAECYALTHDARLRSALERALAHVLAMQSKRNDDRFRGGWGYYFADGSLYDPWPRTSITVWQVMALESARLSGLDVPDAAFDEAKRFLDNAEDERLGAYRYNHEPERLASAWPTLPASTPAALFALALLGEDIADEHHGTARDYVLERAPDGYRYGGEQAFVQRGQGNPYFWYYGTLAMFRLGGTSWQRWNTALQESLLPAQARDGSWQPLDVYALRYARDDAEDKSYTTSLCILSLEVYYRYYLPLLKVR